MNFAVELFEKVFKIIFARSANDLTEHFVLYQIDFSYYYQVSPLFSRFLKNHKRSSILRLQDFRSLFPLVRQGYININDFLIPLDYFLSLLMN